MLFELWKDKKGDLKPAYNKRKNLNVNIQPSLAKEVMEIIGTVAGVKVEKVPTKVVESSERTPGE